MFYSITEERISYKSDHVDLYDGMPPTSLVSLSATHEPEMMDCTK
jgi:hypothetical protein